MNSKDLYLRLLRYVRPHARVFITSLLATVVLAATEPVLPALLKPLLDGSFVAKDPFYITWMPPLIALVFLIRGLAGFASSVAMRWVATRVVMDLRNEMFAKLLVLPDRRFNETPSGNMLSRFTYNVNEVMQAATQALVTLVKDTLSVIGLLAWIFYLNWQLSLITLLIVPSIAIVIRLFSRRLRRLSHQLQDTIGDLNHVIDEVLQGHRVIKIFGGQSHEMKRFQNVNNWVRRFNMKLTISSEGSVPIVQFLTVLGLAAVIYIASQQAAIDEITVGGFVSLFGAMALLLAPIKRLTKLNESLQRGLAAAASVFELLDDASEPDQGTRRLQRARGKIRFQQVDFAYPDPSVDHNKPVLQSIDLAIEPGETIAFVGASGSGKSSLVNLLPRFYDCSSGRILLDDIPLNELKLADLRAQIAYVGQHVVLFNDTLAANINYGCAHEVKRDDMLKAAQDAYALEFIEALPAGFETLIGENGTRLSGGQRQRIAIARALLKNAPVLILDEATSALDTQSERQVQVALDRLRQGRTALVVAHRLSTIENADRIVVLQQGQIAEIGDHAELLAANGVYANLYRLQSQPSTQDNQAKI